MSELRGLIATPPGRTVGSEGLVHADYRNGDHSLSMGGSGQNRRADGNRLPISRESWGDLARESLELLEVVAGRQHHVLDAGGLEIENALDDLLRGPEEIRLLEILERPVGAHHALEDRTLEPERLLAIGRVDQVQKIQMTVAQRVGIAPVAREVLADRPRVVLDHLLAAGAAGEPSVGGGDPREHRRGDVRLVRRER